MPDFDNYILNVHPSKEWMAHPENRKEKLHTAIALPVSVDLRSKCPPIVDQGMLGSCTANMMDGLFRFKQMAKSIDTWPTSRLFEYYNSRQYKSADTGATITDTFGAASIKGMCHESMWPYIIGNFTVLPPVACYGEGLKNLVTQKAMLQQSLDTMKSVIAGGNAFGFGFYVYSGFYMPTGNYGGLPMVPMPAGSALGGHAICAVGYNDAYSAFIVRNSWGTGWGGQGYALMPYSYFLNPNILWDIWEVLDISGSSPPPDPVAKSVKLVTISTLTTLLYTDGSTKAETKMQTITA